MGLVETLPPLSCGVARSSLWPNSAPTWRLFLRPAFGVETEASCGISVVEAREALAFWCRRLARLPWYRAAARAEAREMVALAAAGGAGRARTLAASRAGEVSAPRDRPVWPRGGIPARRVARLMLFAVRATRVGRLLAVVVAAAALSAAVAFVAVAVAVAVLL
jgi:hypothetical protein